MGGRTIAEAMGGFFTQDIMDTIAGDRLFIQNMGVETIVGAIIVFVLRTWERGQVKQ